ncbi:MAG: triose-phosphate isomerase [bacterium]|nr:triose-phosphate isomerase [bacterium]
MRKNIIIANWKMYKTREEALDFIYSVSQAVPSKDLVESVVCAPAIMLRDLVKRQGDNVRIGAENMYYEEEGAFTGEISPKMLTSTNVEFVILGHSERRMIFKEDDALINKKVLSALAHGLKPILCCGETLDEMESGKVEEVLTKQLTEGLKSVKKEDLAKIVIGYEPVWAIGTGKSATAEIAESRCKFCREVIEGLYGMEAEKIRIVYGGSVKPENIADFLKQPDVDGGLIGSASLNPQKYLDMVKAGVQE